MLTDVKSRRGRADSTTGVAEVVNGMLEHLRGIGSDFRNLTHYIAWALFKNQKIPTPVDPEARCQSAVLAPAAWRRSNRSKVAGDPTPAMSVLPATRDVVMAWGAGHKLKE